MDENDRRKIKFTIQRKGETPDTSLRASRWTVVEFFEGRSGVVIHLHDVIDNMPVFALLDEKEMTITTSRLDDDEKYTLAVVNMLISDVLDLQENN